MSYRNYIMTQSYQSHSSPSWWQLFWHR